MVANKKRHSHGDGWNSNFRAKCDGEDPYQNNQMRICFYFIAVSHKITWYSRIFCYDFLYYLFSVSAFPFPLEYKLNMVEVFVHFAHRCSPCTKNSIWHVAGILVKLVNVFSWKKWRKNREKWFYLQKLSKRLSSVKSSMLMGWLHLNHWRLWNNIYIWQAHPQNSDIVVLRWIRFKFFMFC